MREVIKAVLDWLAIIAFLVFIALVIGIGTDPCILLAWGTGQYPACHFAMTK
jgi:hypothetical protein